MPKGPTGYSPPLPHLHLLEVEDLLLAGLVLDGFLLIGEAAEYGSTADLRGEGRGGSIRGGGTGGGEHKGGGDRRGGSIRGGA